jgi:hypothetical protein
MTLTKTMTPPIPAAMANATGVRAERDNRGAASYPPGRNVPRA